MHTFETDALGGKQKFPHLIVQYILKFKLVIIDWNYWEVFF